MTVKDRILVFLKAENISKAAFERSVGMSPGYLRQLRNCPSEGFMEKIAKTYQQLNMVWLRSGSGLMFNKESESEDVEFEPVKENSKNVSVNTINQLLAQINFLQGQLKQKDKVIDTLMNKINLA